MNLSRRSPCLLVCFLAAMLVLSAGALPAKGARDEAPEIPDTPAGRRFSAWLRAFNQGEPEAIKRFAVEHWKYEKPEFPEEEAARSRGLFQLTRGLRLRQAEAIPGGFRAVLQSKLSEFWFEIKDFVEPESPHRIQGFFVRIVDPPEAELRRPALSDRELRDRMDALVSRLVKADAFSGVVLLARGDRAFYTRACGNASQAWNAPNRISTRFGLASITKMFTATAVMQLAEQGRLSYQDPVGKFLPQLSNQEVARKVTIHHLLTHTSGLPGASTPEEYDKLVGAARQDLRTVKDYLALFAGVGLQAEPGTRFSYSNYGYLLLGAIVEAASGQDYYEYVRTHVFRPAGMTTSDFLELDADPRDVATGYMDAPGGTRRSNRFRVPVKGDPAGGAYATATDLLKFSSALRAHTVLSARSLEQAWSLPPSQAKEDAGYGYGFQIDRQGGLRSIWHGGGWFGITNRFEIYPELGYTLVVLSNQDIEMEHLGRKLREWLRQGRLDR